MKKLFLVPQCKSSMLGSSFRRLIYREINFCQRKALSKKKSFLMFIHRRSRLLIPFGLHITCLKARSDEAHFFPRSKQSNDTPIQLVFLATHSVLIPPVLIHFFAEILKDNTSSSISYLWQLVFQAHILCFYLSVCPWIYVFFLHQTKISHVITNTLHAHFLQELLVQKMIKDAF